MWRCSVAFAAITINDLELQSAPGSTLLGEFSQLRTSLACSTLYLSDHRWVDTARTIWRPPAQSQSRRPHHRQSRDRICRVHRARLAGQLDQPARPDLPRQPDLLALSHRARLEAQPDLPAPTLRARLVVPAD